MKVKAFFGDDPVNRRLAIEAAVEAAEAVPASFDLSDQEDFQRAMEMLGDGGFVHQPKLVIWRHAEALTKIRPDRLNELTLDRFEADSGLTVILEIQSKLPRGKVVLSAYKHCFPSGQEIELKTFGLPLFWKEEDQIKWTADLAKSQGVSLGVETDERILAQIQKRRDDLRQTKDDLDEQLIDKRIQELQVVSPQGKKKIKLF